MSDAPFTQLDTAGIARALSQIADRPSDLADVFFERSETIELPPASQAPGFRVWREAGLAVRLVREGRSWLAGRDHIGPRTFNDALRRVARAMPRAPYPEPELAAEPWDEAPEASEVLTFPTTLTRALRTHHVDFSIDLTLRRHRRWTRVVGTQLASGTESENFYSCDVEMPWGRYGTLLEAFDGESAEDLARRLVNLYRARDATPPDAWRGVSILGASATAILLHEAVAHALEADTLAHSGHPEAALGVRMGSRLLDVFDDPASAPEGVKRAADDEGFPVVRRCLLRSGVIEQPLCDTAWARRSDRLTAGAGRRGNRHLAPGPRSSHLELVPGELSRQELFADAEGGLYLPEADRGHLDPITSEFALHFPYGHRISHQIPGEPIGPCWLKGGLRDLLDKICGIGAQSKPAGAGWCAKDGIKLPVWATCPEIRVEGVEITP
ncbi:MAG: metallopeptidase TldD-related protein [Acidobacteriota bacterium]